MNDSPVLLMSQAEIDSDPDRWLGTRATGLTASEAGMLLDLAPASYGGRFVLYHRKLAGLAPEGTPAMERGRWLEPYVASAYADAHPDVGLLPGGLYRHPKREWMMATPDRIAVEAITGTATWPVQLKTSIPEDEFDGSGEFTYLPAHIRAQALWEMEVMGADRVDVPVLFIRPWEVEPFTLWRDDAAERDIALLIEAAEEMLDRLDTQDPPPVDDSPATTDTLRRLYPGIEDRAAQVPVGMARRYRNAMAAARKAEARKRLALNEMLDRAGDAARIVTRDAKLGKARDGYLVRVATRTAGPRRAYTVEAAERVERTNPSGWARGG
jgi:predicted phage-related endonuclease